MAGTKGMRCPGDVQGRERVFDFSAHTRTAIMLTGFPQPWSVSAYRLIVLRHGYVELAYVSTPGLTEGWQGSPMWLKKYDVMLVRIMRVHRKDKVNEGDVCVPHFPCMLKVEEVARPHQPYTHVDRMWS